MRQTSMSKKIMKRILAIIPARSGSKGLKDKNIKMLNGKPLIAYTIESALKSEIFTDVLVSTDSEEYKKIAETYDAWVPFLRPKELAEDITTTNDVIENVLLTLEKMGKKYDDFMILQPTSPLRDEDDIKEAVKLFLDKDANSVVSMCECEHSPLWCKALDEDRKLDGFLKNINGLGRQQLNRYYRLNGAIYLSRVSYFLKYKDLYKNNSYAFVMKKENSIDIDDMFDFCIAESIIKNNK